MLNTAHSEFGMDTPICPIEMALAPITDCAFKGEVKITHKATEIVEIKRDIIEVLFIILN